MGACLGALPLRLRTAPNPMAEILSYKKDLGVPLFFFHSPIPDSPYAIVPSPLASLINNLLLFYYHVSGVLDFFFCNMPELTSAVMM